MTLSLTIIGGYLGAGKTSVVNHLLRHAEGRRLAVLVNEFGALPIDEDLIEAQDDDIISIAGGCVCCSYGNELVLALMKMAELDPPPDHVVLEASGVAIPGAIAASVSLIQTFAIDGIVVLADAETVRQKARDAYVGDTVRRQMADADLIVLNKTDLVSGRVREDLHDWFKEIVPDTGVVEARNGEVPPAALLGSRLEARDPSRPMTEPGAHMFETHSIDVEGFVDADALAQALADPAMGLVRAKGFVRGDAGELVSIQIVGRRWNVAEASRSAAPGLVVIGI